MVGAGGHSRPVVGPNEKVWRLIEDGWYLADSSGKKVVQEAAFVGQVSFIRESLVTLQIVDAVRGGKFAIYGIAELTVSDIQAKTKGSLRIDPDPDWPRDAHAIFIRSSGGKDLQLKHPEVFDLTELAKRTPLRRLPKP